MLVLRKASGIVRFWEGWCGSKGIEIDRSANIKASEALTIPTVTARNSFRIVKAGLSEYCTASRKTSTAVPPPLFRGEVKTWCGAKRLMCFWEGCGNGEVGGYKAIPPSWQQKSLINKKGGRVTNRKQQYQGLCLAVKPPPFDKGGKDIVLFEG